MIILISLYLMSFFSTWELKIVNWLSMQQLADKCGLHCVGDNSWQQLVLLGNKANPFLPLLIKLNICELLNNTKASLHTFWLFHIINWPSWLFLSIIIFLIFYSVFQESHLPLSCSSLPKVFRDTLFLYSRKLKVILLMYFQNGFIVMVQQTETNLFS